MDQHAFFFALVALTCAVEAARAHRPRAKSGLWWLAGIAWFVAFLCKQIPSVFFAPALAAIAVWSERDWLRGAWSASKGVLAAAVALVLPFALAVPHFFERVQTYWIDLPAEEGARRLGYVPGVASVLRRFEETRVQLDLWSISAVHLACVPATLAAALCVVHMWRDREWRWTRALLAACGAEFLLLACLGFIALTGNDKEIGVPLVFASSGLAAAALAHVAVALGARARWPCHAAAALLAVLAVRDAWTFGERVVATRKVNDMTFDSASAKALSVELPTALSNIAWCVPKLVKYTPRDLDELVGYLGAREGAFLLLGDCSPLYGVVGKPSILPALWFHPALTFPVPHDARFPEFEQRLVERFEACSVRTIVIEPRVWVGYRAPEGETPTARLITLDSFPRVRALVDERRQGEREIGAFHVIELKGP